LVEMKSWGPQDLSEAIVIWSGWGRAAWPSRDESLVVDHFGADLAADLLPALRRMEDDFYSSDARHVASDLTEMGKLAADQFRAMHPEIAEKAVRALEWCYTYDYK